MVDLDPGASHSYSADTAADGSFGFDLAPGTYRLAGAMYEVGAGGLATPHEITVSAGESVALTLYVNYP